MATISLIHWCRRLGVWLGVLIFVGWSIAETDSGPGSGHHCFDNLMRAAIRVLPEGWQNIHCGMIPRIIMRLRWWDSFGKMMIMEDMVRGMWIAIMLHWVIVTTKKPECRSVVRKVVALRSRWVIGGKSIWEVEDARVKWRKFKFLPVTGRAQACAHVAWLEYEAGMGFLFAPKYGVLQLRGPSPDHRHCARGYQSSQRRQCWWNHIRRHRWSTARQGCLALWPLYLLGWEIPASRSTSQWGSIWQW